MLRVDGGKAVGPVVPACVAAFRRGSGVGPVGSDGQEVSDRPGAGSSPIGVPNAGGHDAPGCPPKAGRGGSASGDPPGAPGIGCGPEFPVYVFPVYALSVGGASTGPGGPYGCSAGADGASLTGAPKAEKPPEPLPPDPAPLGAGGRRDPTPPAAPSPGFHGSNGPAPGAWPAGLGSANACRAGSPAAVCPTGTDGRGMRGWSALEMSCAGNSTIAMMPAPSPRRSCTRMP